MATIEITSLQKSYRGVLDKIVRDSHETSPRGLKTYDAGHTTIKITNPALPQLPVETGRGVNIDIAAVEAIQLIAGKGMHDLVLKIAPQFERYTNVIGTGDDGEPMVRRFHGNYGDRMRTNAFHECGSNEWHNSWIECAVYKIKNDRDTRQAVVNIWDNNRDNTNPDANDYPCTVAIGFRIFRGALDMHVTMRSNDAWLGLPIDVFQFNQCHWTVANMLCVPLGKYYHTAWSMHVYANDYEKIERVRNRSTLSNIQLPYGFTSVANAGFILCEAVRDYSASERWYVDRLTPYMEETNAGAE